MKHTTLESVLILYGICLCYNPDLFGIKLPIPTKLNFLFMRIIGIVIIVIGIILVFKKWSYTP